MSFIKPVGGKITVDEILMARATFESLKEEQQKNIIELHAKINTIRNSYGKPLIINSGYRRPEDNASIPNAAPKSLHMQCAAIDIKDDSCVFWNWCMDNLGLLKSVGLWLEDKRWTPGWVHMQIRAPRSAKRIFVPSAAPAIKPKIWSGVYDSKWD